MAWKYRPPSRFPARYPAALKAAAASPTIPILLWSSSNPSDLTWEAENFRFYRWCLRQKPEAHPELFQLLSLFHFRTSTDELGIYLTATESHLSQIELLNPHLADILAGSRQ